MADGNSLVLVPLISHQIDVRVPKTISPREGQLSTNVVIYEGRRPLDFDSGN